MTVIPLRSLIIIAIAAASIAGCERYTFTVNERTIFEPPTLFTDYRMTDRALNHCVEQTIIDQGITEATQLTHLVCTHAGISSLEGLTIFTSLKEVNFADNNLDDISPLLLLPHLNAINLTRNPALKCEDAKNLGGQLTDKITLPSHCQ